ncbi:hypothetical protein NUSPORA_00006 [Nucleospora cyclopteri]
MPPMEIENKIEYKLKFLLNSMTLKHIETKYVLEKDKMVEFSNTYCNSNKAQLFCSGINDQTNFPMFNIPLTKDSTIHKVWLCEVAVGNSIYVAKEFIEQNLPIPSGYDSLISDFNSPQAYLSDDQVKIEDFSYIIQDRKRILPIYEITFEYNPEFEKTGRNKNICHKCLKVEAIVYCPSERASFCNECDHAVHADAFLQRHERKYFDSCGQRKFINCKNHETKTIEYFCVNCLEPICSYCKINGSHATLEFAGHEIIPFVTACESLSESITKSSHSLTNHTSKLKLELEKFTTNVGSFKVNIEKVRQQVENDYKNLMLQLENIENNKIQTMNANFLEMIKQTVMFDKMSNFPEELDPTDRLQYYKAILDQRQMDFYPQLTVEPFESIEIVGKIQIKQPTKAGLRITNSLTQEKLIQRKMEAQNSKFNK